MIVTFIFFFFFFLGGGGVYSVEYFRHSLNWLSSFSPSWVTEKVKENCQKIWPREILGTCFSPPGVCTAIFFSRSFLSLHARGTKQERDYSYSKLSDVTNLTINYVTRLERIDVENADASARK